ncbi:TetR/AcrR family transcriptional regulator [Actinomadura madurae]|uniref:TetR/AcrR family transcriptional regulator n=1 Tax=Actinomadura madurae TaxID=1993 RepID=UPI0020275790|nr:TetR/AcrR family transcriptional regulator [Actinomadura madurae]MCP9955790.1 TetR/AcrR family transcriptional regulator [Actinomadura madurae]MCP9972525.1 TetR/AcrR family transcriptional regulator [Actinomadura madurae]MCP9985024.1 TetR/AcrR family transcriptional regulator [Actinomadura madurae]MCQ0021247.1 TetR/AcrR family transcriptional regulator [Actinomadura madurae]URN01250.1 TetR/AcrR family transcriptional regulator [Actinomadura madurae]
MSPRRRDAEGTAAARAGRRAELLATAAEVFASQGYSATTVRQVADAAGILGGSLYYHFDSKESMADEILSTFLDDMWAAYDRVLDAGLNARDTLAAIVVESFRSIDKHRPAVVLYQNESKHLATSERFRYLLDSRRRFEEMWLTLLDRGVKEGVFRADLDRSLVYRFIRDTVWVAANWYQRGGRLSADDIAKQYLAMFLEGIQAS